MATRSYIAIQNEDNTYSAVYCHWDGYLSYNGEILIKQFNDEDRAINLIAKGDISTLCRNGEVVYYEDTKPEIYSNYFDLITSVNNSGAEYLYIFNNGWEYVDLTQENQLRKSVANELAKLSYSTLVAN